MKKTVYKIISKKKLVTVRMLDALLNGFHKVGFFPSDGRAGLSTISDTIRKILVIRLAYIGDVIMTFPVLPALKQVFPHADIDLLTSHAAAPLLENNPHIHDVIRWNAPWFYPQSRTPRIRHIRQVIQSAEYDLGIDFRGDIRNIYHCLWKPGIPRRLSYNSGGGGLLLTDPVSWRELKHKVDYHLDLVRHFGFEVASDEPRIFLTAEEVGQAAERLRQDIDPGIKPIAVHPGARLPLKCWAPERFAELIRKIHRETEHPVILLGGEDDRERADLISAGQPVAADFTGRLNIRELAAIMSLCECVVCHDSASMHIASAVGTQVVALFGPSRPVETAPCGSGHRVIEGSCAVKDFCDERTCTISEHRKCIDSITVEQVAAVCRDVIHSR
jgi:lipopolysaccharide heptosyltransferase II